MLLNPYKSNKSELLHSNIQGPSVGFIRPYLTLAVSLVITDSHLNLPSGFVLVYVLFVLACMV